MLRILIVDSTSVSYRPLREQLPAEEMRIVTVARTPAEARLHFCHTDVVLLDSALPGAPALLREIQGNYPDLKVLITGVEEEAEQILHFVAAGADGYLVQQVQPERIVQKVQTAARGGALISPRVAASLIKRIAFLHQRPTLSHISRSQYESLTPRQREVLSLLHEELTNRQIGERLDIQIGTVKNHVNQILRRLNVHSRYEAATAYANWLQYEGAREAYVLELKVGKREPR